MENKFSSLPQNNEFSRDEKFIRTINVFIESNLGNEQLGVNNIAEAMSTSRAQLYRKLHGITGKNVSQYIREFRLNRAMELLEKDVANVSEVAFRVGFSSTSYFSKCFNVFFGYPPGHVKKIRNGVKILPFQTAAENKMAPETGYDLRGKITTGNKEPDRKSKISSVAVLPFNNLTGNEDLTYFIAGMHDALISEISKIKALRVISRQSTLKFSGSILTIPEIAAQLDVDAIVEVSVLQMVDSIRIQVQMIKAIPEESHILSNSYYYPLQEIPIMYSEIIKDVVQKINIHLTTNEKEQFSKKGVINVDSYEAYLKGTFYWNQLTRGDINQAEKYFQQAIRLDDKYAPAYAGLGLIGLLRAIMGYAPFLKSALNSAQTIDKALELDDTLAEVYFTRGLFSLNGFWDYEKADKNFRKAIELNPNYAYARAYHAHNLLILEQQEESLTQSGLALKLDPFNYLYKGLHGMVLLFTRQYDAAQLFLEKILEEKPNNRLSQTTLRTVYHQLGLYDKAIKIWKDVNNGSPETLEVLEKGYSTGDYQKALYMLGKLFEKKSLDYFVSSWQIGTIYIRAGYKEKAINWIRKAFEEHDPNMPYIKVDPIFDILTDEPEFIRIMDRMNFPSRDH